MAVRMKVRCTSRTEALGSHYDNEKKAYEPCRMYSYNFAFVSGAESEENAKFWSATPSGTFMVSTVLQDAFAVDQSYYLDVSPVRE